MDDRWLEAYLSDLKYELLKHGIFERRILEEVQAHLLDALESELHRDGNRQAAQRRAVQRFGPAQTIANQFYLQGSRKMQKVLAGLAIIAGGCIAYVDSRPTWDDTGITVFALLASSGLLGLLGPKKPWLWALLVGLWLPLYSITTRHDFSMLVTLVFPFLGAYAGMLVRKQVIDRLITA